MNTEEFYKENKYVYVINDFTTSKRSYIGKDPFNEGYFYVSDLTNGTIKVKNEPLTLVFLNNHYIKYEEALNALINKIEKYKDYISRLQKKYNRQEFDIQ